MERPQTELQHLNTGPYSVQLSFSFSRYWSKVPLDAPKTIDEAAARLDQLYESGVPFFTKEAIRTAFEQCQRVSESQEDTMIYLKDLTGAMVEFTTKTGEIKKGDFEFVEYEFLLLPPILIYNSHSQLKDNLLRPDSIDFPSYFSPLHIYHPTIQRNAQTHEPCDPHPTKPQAHVADGFKRYIEDWEESDMCKCLEKGLARVPPTHQIHKIVGLALGGISYGRDEIPSAGVALQHALLLTLRKWLVKREIKEREEPFCYAQDPCYRSVDKVILKQHGVEVIDDPRAWLEIDDTSIVLSVGNNLCDKDIVADIARPAILIWERVYSEETQDQGYKHPKSPARVLKMMEGYDSFEFLAGDTDDHFGNLVLYIRRGQGETCPGTSSSDSA